MYVVQMTSRYVYALAFLLALVLVLLAFDGVFPPAVSVKLRTRSRETRRSLQGCQDSPSRKLISEAGFVSCHAFSQLPASTIAKTCESQAQALQSCPRTCGVCDRVLSSVPNDSLGTWGEKFDMEIIPIHVMILPDGKVLSFGANKAGSSRNPENYYEIWDTTTGEHALGVNHVRYSHETEVNIFCSTLSIDVTTGNVLIIGGTGDIINVVGSEFESNGSNGVLEFDVTTYEMRKHPLGDMRYARWYATSINMPDGQIFVAGGKDERLLPFASSIPEIWNPTTGWRILSDADVPAMKSMLSYFLFGQTAWWYPNVFVNSSGDIFLMIADKINADVYCVGVEGLGSIKRVATRPFDSHKLGPSIMYDVDQVVVLDMYANLWTVDIFDASQPVFTKRARLSKKRINPTMYLLPDGRVMINGGSEEETHDDVGSTEFSLERAVRFVEIWDPVEDTVFKGPEQETARLYHSSGLILPDGKIFSAGGGAPGPIQNSNGQMYYPGFLYDPETGEEASRPLIETWPETILAGDTFIITVADPSVIAKVTATKPGSMTHARNADARWLNLDFQIDGTSITVSTPGPNIMIVGVWYLNVIDTSGVPSPARLFMVPLPE